MRSKQQYSTNVLWSALFVLNDVVVLDKLIIISLAKFCFCFEISLNQTTCVCLCVRVCLPDHFVPPSELKFSVTKWAFSWKQVNTGCPRRKGPNFGRVFLRSNYTDITQNTYIQCSMVTEILAREVWNFDSYYSLIDYQIHIETGRNMWFL